MLGNWGDYTKSGFSSLAGVHVDREVWCLLAQVRKPVETQLEALALGVAFRSVR